MMTELPPPRFLRALSLTLAVVLFTNFAVLEAFTRGVLIPSDIKAMKERMLLAMPRVETVAFGDSHVLNALDVEDPTFFNFARGGDTPPILYFKMKWLLEHGIVPQTILLQFDYNVFSAYRADPGRSVWMYADIIDEPVPEELGSYPLKGRDQVLLHSLSESYSPIVHRSFGRYLLGNLRKPRLSPRGHITNGADWSKFSEDERQRRTQRRLETQVYPDPLIVPGLLAYYERIIEMAKANDIDIIGVRYPLSPEYLAGIGTEDEAEFEGMVSGMAGRHGFPVLDYRRVFDDRQDYLSNQDHLNKVGAKAFSVIVAQDLASMRRGDSDTAE